MAFVSAGFDGTVDEKQFAKMLHRYAVVGADDFKASNVAGADRMLSIADGTALGPGTLDVGSAFSPIQFDAVTSGTTRWDLVVLRRDWQPPGGNTSIAVIKGGATKVLPSRNQNPGVIDDQPLYLQEVRAGSTSLGTRVDLRVWQGPGGAEAADRLALTYLAQPGAEVKIGDEVHRYEMQDNGVWDWAPVSWTPRYFAPLTPSSLYSNTGIIQVVGRVRHVAISINRVAGTLTVGKEFVSLGNVIPVGARTTTDRVFYKAGWFYGSSGANYPCNYFVNMQTGAVQVRIQSSTPVTYTTNVSLDIDLTAIA